MIPGLPDGLVLTPATTDVAVARTWMLGHGASGIEGIVAKRLDQTYRPGVRAWHKLRTRVTAEAFVGGVLGPVEAPRELILGRFDDNGRLRIAGRTTRLSPTAGAELAALLRPATAHPWPDMLPPHPYGAGALPTPASRPRWSSSCRSTSPWTGSAGGTRCGSCACARS